MAVNSSRCRPPQPRKWLRLVTRRRRQTSVERASVIARCHTDPMADPLPLKRGFIVVVETPEPDGGQLSRRGYLVAAEGRFQRPGCRCTIPALGGNDVYSRRSADPRLPGNSGAAWSGIATGRLKPAPRIPDGWLHAPLSTGIVFERTALVACSGLLHVIAAISSPHRSALSLGSAPLHDGSSRLSLLGSCTAALRNVGLHGGSPGSSPRQSRCLHHLKPRQSRSGWEPGPSAPGSPTAMRACRQKSSPNVRTCGCFDPWLAGPRRGVQSTMSLFYAVDR